MASSLIHDLERLLSKRGVVSRREELITYECDGSTMDKFVPDAVVFPETTQDVSHIIKYLQEKKIPFVARGAGTGLSGGILSVEGGVVISTTRMKKIIEVDPVNRCAIVEPGVVNIHISRAAAEHGLHFAPDPSSQAACTIGGNVSENAGGPHCLKYGATAQHILGLEMVLPDGEVLTLGGKSAENFGYDLIGVVVGSEGTFGIVTKIIVKLLPLPQDVRTLLAVFDSVRDATQTVSDIIASGIVPAALEMIDNTVLNALEDAFHFGFPLDAGSLLIIEVDGLAASLDRQAQVIRDICAKNNSREVRAAKAGPERDALWKARKRAFGALGRITPSYYTQDGVIPRGKLPEVLEKIKAIGDAHGLRIANIFHAGDGNLHPCILFDERDDAQRKNVIAASEEILKLCIDVGGSITGEHGIGLEKMNYTGFMFSETDQKWMLNLRSVFNPDGLCNPGKIFPMGKNCVEVDVKHRRVAL
ncbi:MAG TPA: FAD-linked oxidase C-terminal domain-containing protein [Candidatus Kapabacteria bacterium]|nr:FAD-linked oxidase C-terminal domain-containing protein [Candidatus Kapabacteria bacterium]